MKAAVLTEYRKDFEITEVQDPTITEPNDVIVRVGACGTGSSTRPTRRLI
jgi:threonine dehydrogenase-like Zn-dependent dehydrogenase